MGDILKGLVALFVVCAALKYGGERLVKKTVEIAQNGGDEYKLDIKPLEFPETHFEWNGGNMSGGLNQGQANWNGGD